MIARKNAISFTVLVLSIAVTLSDAVPGWEQSDRLGTETPREIARTAASIYASSADTVVSGMVKRVCEFEYKSEGYCEGDAWRMPRSGEVGHSFFFPNAGDWRLCLEVAVDCESDSPPELTLVVDGLETTTSRLENCRDFGTYTYYLAVPAGVHRISWAFRRTRNDQSLTLGELTLVEDDFSDHVWLQRYVPAVLDAFGDRGCCDWENWKLQVLLLGLTDAYEVLRWPEIVEFIRQRAESLFDSDGSFTGDLSSDWTTVAYLLYWLFRQTGDEKYRRALALGAKPSDVQAFPRISNGAFVHLRRLRDQIWDDSLHGLTYYFLPLYWVQHRRYYLEELVFQFKKHAEILQDPQTGLFYHAYDEDGSASWAAPLTHRSPHFWARGNGWILISLVDLLWNLPLDWDRQERGELVRIFRRLCEGIRASQDSTGLWYTVLDEPGRPGNYLELSGSALFVAGLSQGVRLGLLNGEEYRDCISRALRALSSRHYRDPQGRYFITAISGPTGPGDFDRYVSVDLGDGFQYPYGSGCYLHARARSTDTYYTQIMGTLSVSVDYVTGARPVPQVQIQLGRDEWSNQVFTDGLGHVVCSLPPGTYSAFLSRPPEENTLGCITFYDAALAARTALGLEPPTDIQILAADVHPDGEVTVYDAAIIARWTIGLPVPDGACPGRWFFSPDSLYFDLAAGDSVELSSTGVLMGDVDGSWGQPLLQRNSRPEAISPVVVWRSGDTIKAEVRLGGAVDVWSFLLEVEVRNTEFKFVSVDTSGFGPGWKILQNLTQGCIRVGGYGLYESHDMAKVTVRLLADEISGEPSVAVRNFFLNGRRLRVEVNRKESETAEAGLQPREFVLDPAYPNPFSKTVRLRIKLPAPGREELAIFDTLGRRVALLVDERLGPGVHTFHWGGTDSRGRPVAPGVYWLRWIHNGKMAGTCKLLYLP